MMTGGAGERPRRAKLCRCLALEPGRADLAECRMSASLVIEHYDVIHLRLAVARKPVGLLLLHGREEALHHGIVAAVRPTIHAARTTAGTRDTFRSPHRCSGAAIRVVQESQIGTTT